MRYSPAPSTATRMPSASTPARTPRKFFRGGSVPASGPNVFTRTCFPTTRS